MTVGLRPMTEIPNVPPRSNGDKKTTMWTRRLPNRLERCLQPLHQRAPEPQRHRSSRWHFHDGCDHLTEAARSEALRSSYPSDATVAHAFQIQCRGSSHHRNRRMLLSFGCLYMGRAMCNAAGGISLGGDDGWRLDLEVEEMRTGRG